MLGPNNLKIIAEGHLITMIDMIDTALDCLHEKIFEKSFLSILLILNF